MIPTIPLIQGLWLRLEDAEVFFYATSRINSDQRFQIEQRPVLHIVNGTSSYEIMTYSLTIDDVRLSDDGTYSCQADNRIIKLFVLNIVGKHDDRSHEFMIPRASISRENMGLHHHHRLLLVLVNHINGRDHERNRIYEENMIRCHSVCRTLMNVEAETSERRGSGDLTCAKWTDSFSYISSPV